MRKTVGTFQPGGGDVSSDCRLSGKFDGLPRYVCSTTTLSRFRRVSTKFYHNRDSAQKDCLPLVKQIYYYASSFSKKSVTQNPKKMGR